MLLSGRIFFKEPTAEIRFGIGGHLEELQYTLNSADSRDRERIDEVK